MSEVNNKSLSIAMLVDAWFPFWGGGQVHVKNLSDHLTTTHKCSIKLYHPPHSHIVIRFLWSAVVPLLIFKDHLIKPFALIHSHGYNSGLAGKLASILILRPVIHTVHGSNLLDQQSKSFKARIEKFILTQIKYSAQITVSSSFLAHPNVNCNIDHIPNGVNVTDFDLISTTKNTRPTIIYVGRIDDPIKGFSYLQQAVDHLKLKFPRLKLNVVTGGRLTGDRLIKAYKQANLFVLPSLSEGQPITLLEAWAAKLPVIVTKVGENPHMVVHQQNGYLIDPADLNQLESAITQLLLHPKQSKRLGLAGYQLVKSKFTWDKVAKETYKIYQKLTKNRYNRQT